MANGDSHTRSVQIAKIVLPLIALGILSTLFMVSREIDPEAAIPYAAVDVEGIAREQRLSNARYAAVGPDGASIELSAVDARPNPDVADRIDATTISGTIDLPGGAQIVLRSGGAMVDMAQQTAGLVDDVLITSTIGYKVHADRVLAHMDAAELTSEGPVRIEAPFGNLDAGNMLLTKVDGDYRLVFNNRVKLVYLP